MIKYPLYVTLDTNIFVSNKYDFGKNSTLGLLAKYVKLGKIKVVLSNIVIKEVEKHIIDESNKICSSIRKLRADILKNVSEEYIKQIGLDHKLEILNKDTINEKSQTEWNHYIKKVNPEILDNTNINLDEIITNYFNFKPPFEDNDKKRKEFPDAFIAYKIKKRFGTEKTVAIVSNDNGFKAACGKTPNHLFYKSLGDLYDAMNREESEYKEAVKTVTSLMSMYILEINKVINDNEYVEVHGLAYDKDGIMSGYDYSETFVSGVTNTSCKIRTIDEISETTIQATLLCETTIDVECYYDDYDNAAWDSETESYFYLETKEIVETHKTRFACRLEINRDGDDFQIFPFKVILNGDSLLERIEKDNDEDDYEQDIISQEREELGFCSLNSYGDYLRENLIGSAFETSVISLFDKINDLYGEYEEIAAIYDDFVEIINNGNSKEVIKLLSKNLSGSVEFPHPVNLNKISDDEIDKVVLWAKQACDRLSKLSKKRNLPNTISYGEVIDIFDNDEQYKLVINNFEATPSKGDVEYIDINIKDKMGNIVSKGYVELTVGFLEFDDDNCAGDGLNDNIEYMCDDVITALEKILENISLKLQEEWNIARILEDSIAIDE